MSPNNASCKIFQTQLPHSESLKFLSSGGLYAIPHIVVRWRRLVVIDSTSCFDEIHGNSAKGHEVLNSYNLVAANSGGSIVLAGLIEDLTLEELLTYFENEQIRRSIFSPTSWVGDRLLHWLLGIGPKYSAANKLPALQKLMPKFSSEKRFRTPRTISGTYGC